MAFGPIGVHACIDPLAMAGAEQVNPAGTTGGRSRTARAGETPVVDRRTFLKATAVLAGAIGAGVPISSALASLGAKRSPGAPARRVPPNILVILVDQMRSPCWFAPGSAPTGLPPNLARLRHGGVSFGRHYTAANDCTPARSTLVTGLHTHQTGCMITGASMLEPGFPTWGTMLREQGYGTYWYGKWHLTHGDNHWAPGGVQGALEPYGFAGGTYPSPNGGPGQGLRADPYIARQFQDWYRSTAAAGRWCTTVSFVNPHDIAWWYRFSAGTASAASASRVVRRLPPNFETPVQLLARRKPLVQLSFQETTAEAFGALPYSGPDAERRWLPFLDLYVRLQLEVDAQIGAVLDTLASKPHVAANTVVVFTSDHGEYAASHGLRGKGASVYEEAIRVPLIVKDLRGRLTADPARVRTQITSSVDVAPLLLTIACGSDEWRADRRYAHLAARPDLARLLSDPAAPGRGFALHATDEVFTEYALQPHAASAPLHVVGVITPTAKYAAYSHWRPGTLDPLAHGEQRELYDHSTRDGRLEIANLAGCSTLEGPLRKTLEHATRQELRAPVTPNLRGAQLRGFSNYLYRSVQEAHASRASRLRQLAAIVDGEIPS